MLQIDFSLSFKKIDEFVQNYNEQFICAKESSCKQKNVGASEQINDIKNMLRTSHITLMKRLVECLSSQINKDQKLRGPIDYCPEDDDMPELRTNNVSLAKSLGCNPKTIYNQLKRLEKANFICEKNFRGSRSDYKIKLNTQCLQLILNGDLLLAPKYENTVHKPVKKACESVKTTRETVSDTFKKRVTQSNGKKKIHHTEQIKIIENNNNNRSGEIVDYSTISGILDSFKGNTTNQESQKRNQNLAADKPVSEPYQTCEPEKTPPPVLRTPQDEEKIPQNVEKYGQLLLNFMFSTVFSKMPYYAPKQIKACKGFVIRELSGLNERDMKAKFKEIRVRLLLAWEYVQRDPENRFIPNSPMKYFDPDNQYGYAGTKIWYDKFKDNKRKIDESNDLADEYMKRWDWMNKAIDRYLKNPNSQGYFSTKRIIKAKYPEILDAFEQMVIFKNNKLSA